MATTTKTGHSIKFQHIHTSKGPWYDQVTSCLLFSRCSQCVSANRQEGPWALTHLVWWIFCPDRVPRTSLVLKMRASRSEEQLHLQCILKTLWQGLRRKTHTCSHPSPHRGDKSELELVRLKAPVSRLPRTIQWKKDVITWDGAASLLF